MASIQKRGKSSFLLVVEVGEDTRGKRDKHTKTVRVEESLLKTPKKLRDHLNEELMKFKIEVESGVYIRLDTMKFSSFVDEWKVKFLEKHLESTSQLNYLFHLNKRILPYFGHMQINKIKPLHIESYLDELSKSKKEKHSTEKEDKLGSATLVYNFRVLRSIFIKAKEWKVIQQNPMDGVKKPKEKQKEVEVYSEDEVSILFDLLENEEIFFQALIYLATTTGMRRAELLGLEWKHIDFKNGIIDIKQSIPMFKDGAPVIKDPKNKGSKRRVVIPPIVLNKLEEFKKKSQKDQLSSEDVWLGGEHRFLFAHDNGIPYYPHNLTDRWIAFHKKNKEHGLKYIRLHDLRHTSATLLINSGVHAKIISSRLGHSKIGTTMNVYGHVIESADRTAADKFEGIFSKKNKTSKPKAE
ncbi:site-specific integrase [Paenibacillus taichungensis]|uniref:tyrosine-type recombinase/integrase n=1 Tax=Paenibacillus taichungensis TaxID=484184 RepID=UPI002DB94537|nr:site-specific integrase [Paenibacillus taichungensis]MEC0110467.1 site-specific integrase [Paenibacillus taichungensis]MEC0200146.1 site-specific integrase [Paenibacillus taichungensis]